MTSVRLSDITKVFPNGKVGLQGITFSISEGERVGLIGPNGAGKSTLLSIIAGLANPSSGTLQVEGDVSAILALGLTVREELTGRAFIKQECGMRGMSDLEIQDLLPSIIDFADIGAFIDRPMRTYSTGMKARVIFAANVWITPEILLLDEVLSVGDRDFNEKASAKIRELTNAGSILLLSSHSMAAINVICDRCLRLESGRLIDDGDAVSVTRSYLESVHARQEDLVRTDWFARKKPSLSEDGWSIEEVWPKFGVAPGADLTAITNEPTCFTVRVAVPEDESFTVRLEIHRLDGTSLLEHESPQFRQTQIGLGAAEVDVNLDSFPLNEGHFSLQLSLRTAIGDRARVTFLLKVINLEPISGGKPTYVLPGRLSVIDSEGSCEAIS